MAAGPNVEGRHPSEQERGAAMPPGEPEAPWLSAKAFDAVAAEVSPAPTSSAWGLARLGSGHGSAAVTARDAVVAGDLDAFRVAARRVDQRFPLGTGLGEDAVELAIADARRALDLPAAAAALGDLAVACGGCHLAVGARIPSPVSTLPVGGDDLWDEMARHDEGLQLLWAGLVRPARGDLEEGLRVFESATFHVAGREPPPTVRNLDAQVHRYAARVVTASPRNQGAALSELLLTCAACHVLPPEGAEPGPR
jgi:hypothetical protein